ncbi:ABC transporter related protein [Desulforamulus reducens MI-1]|uniref:ABC transporter related protein n=1 Tax=Desulforamulus reducens (strain ATCC BAA-1160 / DSM 100696 / MI-1) TaxID=349161 RepID=A4J5I0_DESRM|nr:ATP-binding cassette domain-containing protein [Desulforamulus reducens]ABO50333.1 ABC transporter related protein [Desulforamulus reducens MI-1]
MLFAFEHISYDLGIDPVRHINVSGSLHEGEVLVVRGPSGAGKSTLMRILAKLQTNKGGRVHLRGESWDHIPPPYWRCQVHYLAQKTVLFDGTIASNLARPFEIRIHSDKVFKIKLAQDLMEQLLLPPALWEQDAKTLSGGEAARVALIRAMLIDPAILLLDEPTAALDDQAREVFYSLLKKWLKTPGRAAMLISHNHDYQTLDWVSFLDIVPS